jgi:GNAT superfamily N-acetyltransferase
MSEADGRHTRLLSAARPRQATAADADDLAQLLATIFLHDPVFDWTARTGQKRAEGLRRFFLWVLRVRAIPFGEVWTTDDGNAIAAWLPPGAPASPGGIVEQVRLLPMFVNLCGWSRLLRGSAMADCMEKKHPPENHFYLAFLGVAPPMQGMGLGSAILEATLKRVDASGLPAYLENSNPKNTPLYRRNGFAVRGNIEPRGAPPMLAMWRPAAGNAKLVQGSSSLSQ